MTAPCRARWRNAARAVLSAWCDGRPGPEVTLTSDTVPASELLAGLGERSPLKEWQLRPPPEVREMSALAGPEWLG